MIKQAASWAPHTNIKVIRGVPLLHYSTSTRDGTMDGSVFICFIVDPILQKGLGSFLCIRSAEFNTEPTLSLSFKQI